MGYNERNMNCQESCPEGQRHVHELQGSVKMADREDPHNHRFCTVTGEAIPYGNNDHVHDVTFRTDTFDDHYHEFRGRTGCVIPVDNDRHVHFIESVTSMDDGHRHAFEAATLIQNPTGLNRKQCEHDEKHDHKHCDHDDKHNHKQCDHDDKRNHHHNDYRR